MFRKLILFGLIIFNTINVVKAHSSYLLNYDEACCFDYINSEKEFKKYLSKIFAFHIGRVEYLSKKWHDLTTAEADKKDFRSLFFDKKIVTNLANYEKIFAERKANYTKYYKIFKEQRKNNSIISYDDIKKMPRDVHQFFLYANGVAEIKQNPKTLYPEAWEKLLTEYDKSDVLFRIGWVYYMLGNLHIKNGLEDKGVMFYTESVIYKHEEYKDTVDSFDLGYVDYRNMERIGTNYKESLIIKHEKDKDIVDSLNLGYASYRNMGRNCKKLKNKIYGLICWYFASKDDVQNIEETEQAFLELKHCLITLYNLASLKEKKEVLKDSLSRNLIILAHSLPYGKGYHYPVEIIKLLPDDTKLFSIDRLACLAFIHGDLQDCQKYLKKLSKGNATRLWLEGKIFYKQEKYYEAVKKMRLFLKFYLQEREREYHYFPQFDVIEDVYGVLGSALIYNLLKENYYGNFGGFDNYHKVKNEAHYQALREELNPQKNIKEALFAFYRTNSKVDIEYVAMHLISLAELKVFCKEYAFDLQLKNSSLITDMLIERLIVEKSYKEALNYPTSNKMIKMFIILQKEINDNTRTDEEKAISLYKLGLLFNKYYYRSSYSSNFLSDFYPEMFKDRILNCGNPNFINEMKFNKKNLRKYYYMTAILSFINAADLIDDVDCKIEALIRGIKLLPKKSFLRKYYLRKIYALVPHEEAERIYNFLKSNEEKSLHYYKIKDVWNRKLGISSSLFKGLRY